MSVCLLRIADGRDAYHDACWESAKVALPAVEHIVTVDDREHRLGFAGAIQQGWREALESGCDHVLHLEMDFTFREPVQLDAMCDLLDEHEHLAQVALKRQPVNAEEIAAGGIVEQHPEDFRQRVENGVIWTEHRRFFSTNPCVYATALCRHGWPQVEHSEGMFTHRLLADPDVRFAYWGGKFDAPLVEHIGHARSGTGY
jgi:hypothetical protein